MKKIIASILVLLFAVAATAQKTDLVISDISLLGSSKSDTRGQYFIKVKVTIRNRGEMATGDFKLAASHRRTGLHGEEWALFGEPIPAASIRGLTTITRVFVFACNLSDLGRGTYSEPFKLTADFYNTVRESNEDNNDSAEIVVELELGTP